MTQCDLILNYLLIRLTHPHKPPNHHHNQHHHRRDHPRLGQYHHPAGLLFVTLDLHIQLESLAPKRLVN
jgi:hypothetical protein